MAFRPWRGELDCVLKTLDSFRISPGTEALTQTLIRLCRLEGRMQRISRIR